MKSGAAEARDIPMEEENEENEIQNRTMLVFKSKIVQNQNFPNLKW